MPTRPLFRTVETAAAITDSVLVSFSGGKDSVATLDLCVKHFRHVEGFFMYYVKGLSFQEQICRYYEDRYGLPIHRVPHFELSQFLRYGLYRPTDFSVPVVSVKDVYNYLRLNTDIWWIAAGERITDSVWRRAIIKSSGTIDEKRGRIYPVAEWRKEDVVAYIRQNKLKVGVESRKLGFSFGSLQAREVIPVKLHFPADFARIRAWFPFRSRRNAVGGKLSKYQKFEVEVISRGEIHGADYNPRVISEDARKRLKRMLAKHGLVQPLVWNRRTGNLVSGHQRLSQLDQLERSQDYDLQVSVVDVDEREEKILNVQLNNPSMQGDWDMDKLNGLAGENGIDPEEFGFSSGDISVMFDSDMGGAFSDTEEVAEAKDTLREIKEHRAESTENMKREASGEFYFTVVCENEGQKKAMLKALGVPHWEAFVHGSQLAGLLGV